jgi:hypothetical protein
VVRELDAVSLTNGETPNVWGSATRDMEKVELNGRGMGVESVHSEVLGKCGRLFAALREL